MWTKDCVSDDILEKANVGMGAQSVMENEIRKFYFKTDYELLLISQAGQFLGLPLESGGVQHTLFFIVCLRYMMEQWHRLPSEAVKPPSLEIFKSCHGPGQQVLDGPA